MTLALAPAPAPATGCDTDTIERLLTTLPEVPATQRVAIANLLATVSLAEHREHSIDTHYGDGASRCWHCRRTGKLVGHHATPTTVVMVHPKCHTRLHRQHLPEAYLDTPREQFTHAA